MSAVAITIKQMVVRRTNIPASILLTPTVDNTEINKMIPLYLFLLNLKFKKKNSIKNQITNYSILND